MSGSRTQAGQASARGRRFAIVATRFNEDIVDRLVDGARQALREHGAADADVRVWHVPGAFELPLGAQAIARKGGVDAIIAMGCVIRGGTPHFEYVSGACVDGLAQVALSEHIPVALGVLTTDNQQQAEERVQPGPANKGYEAALAAIEMADLAAQIASS